MTHSGTPDPAGVWLHSTPAELDVGAWIVPAAQRDGHSRTHPRGYGPTELAWYSPDVVYVFDSGDVDPTQHLNRFAFSSADNYLYEVTPHPPFGLDLDPGQPVFRSITCARARIVRCIHAPSSSTGPTQPGHDL